MLLEDQDSIPREDIYSRPSLDMSNFETIVLFQSENIPLILCERSEEGQGDTDDLWC